MCTLRLNSVMAAAPPISAAAMLSSSADSTAISSSSRNGPILPVGSFSASFSGM